METPFKKTVRKQRRDLFVLTEVCRSEGRCSDVKNSESRIPGHCLSRPEPILGRMHKFRKESVYEAFERIMVQAYLRQPFLICRIAFDPWPVERPARVNAALSMKELNGMRVSIERGRPYGEEMWVRETVKVLGVLQALCPERRLRKARQLATEATN